MAYLVFRAVEDDADWTRQWYFDRRWNDLYETSMLAGGSLHPEIEKTLPEAVRITKAEYWPDFVIAKIFLIVTHATAHILKSLEPNAHQYFSLRVEDQTGTTPDRLFLVHCTNRIQPIIINKSDVAIKPPPPPKKINGKIITGWRQMSITRDAINPKLILDKKTIGSRHLWLGPLGGLTAHWFISDGFKEQLAKLRPGLRFIACKEWKQAPTISFEARPRFRFLRPTQPTPPPSRRRRGARPP